MTAKPITIGGRTFATRDAALEHVREVRDRHVLRAKIVGEDDTFLRDLFVLHPEASEKLSGHTILHFEVRRNRHGTKSFYFKRSDGFLDDFSFMKCLASVGAPASQPAA
jgi:hypothetical protein